MERLFRCIRMTAKNASELSVELILVNDSPQIAVEYAPEWVDGFSFRLVTNQTNMGIHGSRVQGLLAATGEFVIFLDQDDLLAENTFSSQYALSTDADVVLANGYYETAGEQTILYPTQAYQRQAACGFFYYRVSNLITSPGQCLLRRSGIPKLWQEKTMQTNGSDDLLLWLLTFEENLRWKCNPQCLYTHMDTGENVSANLEKMIRSSCEVWNILRENGRISHKNSRLFLRRIRMYQGYAGKPLLRKMLAMLQYPDVAWWRLQLIRYKKQRT